MLFDRPSRTSLAGLFALGLLAVPAVAAEAPPPPMAEQMDFRWIADRVPVPDLEEVIRGSLQAPTVRHGPNASFWYPKEGGIESLSKALYERLEPARVKTETEVSAIDPTLREVTTTTGRDLRVREPDHVAPAAHAREAHARCAAGGAPRAADQLESNTVFTVLLGIGRENISDHHWVYTHENDLVFHRISYPMNFSESLVPPGCSSVMAEISHSPHRDLTGRDLIAETIDGLQRMGVLRPDDEIRVVEDRQDLTGVRDLHARPRGGGHHDPRVDGRTRGSTRSAGSASGRTSTWTTRSPAVATRCARCSRVAKRRSSTSSPPSVACPRRRGAPASASRPARRSAPPGLTPERPRITRRLRERWSGARRRAGGPAARCASTRPP